MMCSARVEFTRSIIAASNSNGTVIADHAYAAFGASRSGVGSEMFNYTGRELGPPGLFYRAGAWGGLGNRHFELGNIPRISFRAGDTPIFEDGRLLILADPTVREAARQYGDPDELLRQFEWGDTPLT